jgi:predicted metal-dependent hydrolase
LIDLQKLLDDPSLSQDEREELEAFAEKFERYLREQLAAMPTAQAKEKALDEVGRMLEEFTRKVREIEKPH